MHPPIQRACQICCACVTQLQAVIVCSCTLMWAAVKMASCGLCRASTAQSCCTATTHSCLEDVEAKLGAKYSSLEDLVKCVLAYMP